MSKITHFLAAFAVLLSACGGSSVNSTTSSNPTATITNNSFSQPVLGNPPASQSTQITKSATTPTPFTSPTNKPKGIAGSWNLAAMIIGGVSTIFTAGKPNKSLTYFAAKLSQDPSWFPMLQKDGDWIEFFEDGSLTLKYRMPLQSGTTQLKTSSFLGKYSSLSDRIKVEMSLQSGEHVSLPKKGIPTFCDLYALDEKNFMWMICPDFGGGAWLLSRSGTNIDAIDSYLLKQSGPLGGVQWKPVGRGESCSFKELNQAQRALLRTQYQDILSKESGRTELLARGTKFYDAAHATVFFDDGSFFMGGTGGTSLNGKYEVAANTLSLTFDPMLKQDELNGQYPFELDNGQFALIFKIQGHCILMLFERS